MSEVSIIGGCGRVGLRLGLHAASKGHHVTCIDFDEERINEIKQGSLPFTEAGAEVYLESTLKNKSLKVSSEFSKVKNSEVIIIAIGTPADSNLNPSLEPIAGAIFDISEFLKKKQLLIFRSTISPEAAVRIKTLVEEKSGYKIGKDIYLAFAPEILAENNSIHDLATLPQPIGAYEEESFKQAQSFFSTITKGKISWLSPEEVLLLKLMNNTVEYINSACANEFYLISQSYKANYHKMIDAIHSANKDIPIQHLNPNSNASGPGTHKEGWFITNRLPFCDLITSAFKINESMPQQIANVLENYKVKKIVILGMTNKANSDDTNSSLSYKIRKILLNRNYEVYSFDPHLPEYSDSSVLKKADAIILMTTHKEFHNLNKIKSIINNPQCIYIDFAGFWEETRNQGINGILKFETIKQKVKNKK